MSNVTTSDDRVKKLEFLGISPVEVGLTPALTGIKATKLMHELEERAGKLEMLLSAAQKAKNQEDRVKHAETIEEDTAKQLEKAKQLGPEAKGIRDRLQRLREDAGKLRASGTTPRKSFAPVEQPETPKQQLAKLAQQLKELTNPEGADLEEAKKLNQLRRESVEAIKGGDVIESTKLVKDLERETESVKSAVQERANQKSTYENASRQLSAKLAEAHDVLTVTAKLKTLKKDLAAAEKGVNDAAKKGEYKQVNDTHLPALTKAVKDLLDEQQALTDAESQLMSEWPAVYIEYKKTADVKRTKAGAAQWSKLDKAYEDFTKPYAAYDFKTAKGKLPALSGAIVDVLAIPAGETADDDEYWDAYFELKDESSDYDKLLKDGNALVELAGANLGATPDGLAVKQFVDAHNDQNKLYYAHEFLDAAQACEDMAGLVGPAEAAVGRLHAQFANCKSKWKGLKDKLKEALEVPETTQDVKSKINDMKVMHGTVAGRMGNLQFDNVTIMALDELARRAGLVVTAHEKYKKSREAYDKAWEKEKFWFEYGRDARDNLKNPPRDLISLMTKAEKEFQNIQEKLAAFDFNAAESIVKGGFKTQAGLVYSALRDLFDQRSKCEEYFKAQVGEKQDGVQAGTPELVTLVGALNRAQAEYDKAFKAWDFDAARGAVAAVKEASKAVAAAAAKLKTEGRPKATAAKNRINELKDNGLLDLRSQDEKIKLLADLQGVPEKLTDDERAAQREIYKCMPMDPKFVAKDAERRRKIVQDVVGDEKDKKEFKAAMNGWPGKSNDEKLALAKKLSAKQCASMGIKAIPVLLVEKPPSNCGGFVPSSREIHLNKNNKAFQTDFEDVMNTVFHETGHWYQLNLVERFNNGEISPDDDEYAQIQMFALNDNRKDAYVPPKEDDETYRKQPQEAHAFELGNETAKLFCKALS